MSRRRRHFLLADVLTGLGIAPSRSADAGVYRATGPDGLGDAVGRLPGGEGTGRPCSDDAACLIGGNWS